MKIYSISVLRNDGSSANTLAAEYNLAEFGYFQRSSVQEFMGFFSKTVAERTLAGQRQSIDESNYVGHVYARAEGIAGVVITDKEYPQRVAFSLLNKILDEFIMRYPPEKWTNNVQYPELAEYLKKYQDPKQADSIMKVQRDLDDTKVILHKTIEGVLQRGEKLDSLIERSEELSSQSKVFYKTAKKTNSCCVVM
ncbi:Longin-like domain-containing protein [Umbelopsis sp. PMI_123]|nr:Longin-like domain-containing protein [Umbelopsis sp. PMI_123]